MEKYGTAGQTTDDNMAHAHGVLDTLVYRHTLRICNTYCFSTASVVGTNAPQFYVICTLRVLFCKWCCYHSGGYVNFIVNLDTHVSWPISHVLASSNRKRWTGFETAIT